MGQQEARRGHVGGIGLQARAAQRGGVFEAVVAQQLRQRIGNRGHASVLGAVGQPGQARGELHQQPVQLRAFLGVERREQAAFVVQRHRHDFVVDAVAVRD